MFFSKKNFDRYTKKYDILLVYFFSPASTPSEEKNWELTESMLELAAQITEREGVAFGVVDLSKFWSFFDVPWRKVDGPELNGAQKTGQFHVDHIF